MSEETNVTEKKGFLLDETKLEIVIAIALAITALLTAWASWISALHGGNQATNYATSNNTSAEGNSMYNEGNQNMIQDMMLWNEISDLQLDYLYAQSMDDVATEELAAYKLYTKCNDNLSDAMAAQLGWDFDEAANAASPATYIEAWISTDAATISPFADEEFENSYFTDATAKIAEADEILQTGIKDNANGDAYNLATVFYSVVLFLLGIAGTLKKLPNRRLIVLVAIFFCVLSTVYMFTIPMPTGFNFASFFTH